MYVYVYGKTDFHRYIHIAVVATNISSSRVATPVYSALPSISPPLPTNSHTTNYWYHDIGASANVVRQQYAGVRQTFASHLTVSEEVTQPIMYVDTREIGTCK